MPYLARVGSADKSNTPGIAPDEPTPRLPPEFNPDDVTDDFDPEELVDDCEPVAPMAPAFRRTPPTSDELFARFCDNLDRAVRLEYPGRRRSFAQDYAACGWTDKSGRLFVVTNRDALNSWDRAMFGVAAALTYRAVTVLLRDGSIAFTFAHPEDPSPTPSRASRPHV